MKNYFKRLKDHPGLLLAFLMTALCFVAAATNNNIHSIKGVLILGAAGSLIFWLMVLISNFK